MTTREAKKIMIRFRKRLKESIQDLEDPKSSEYLFTEHILANILQKCVTEKPKKHTMKS